MLNLDSFTLLVAAIMLYLVVGAVLALMWWRERLPAIGWWAASFTLAAVGFALLARGQGWRDEPQRSAAIFTFLLAFSGALAAARAVSERRAAGWALLVGPLAWALVVAFGGPLGLEATGTISSALFCLYSLAIGVVLWRSAGRLPLRLGTAYLWLLHGCVFLVRLGFGLAYGLTGGWTESMIAFWGTLLVLEAILFMSVLAVLVAGMTIEQRHFDHRRLAFTDALTGLGNRRAFEHMLDGLTPLPPMAPPWPILLLIDLDGFKQINDAFGHPEGDRLLATFARAIQAWLEEPGLFWRLGGDEFAILLRGQGPGEARATAERVCKTIREVSHEATLPGRRLTLTIGLALVAPGLRREEIVTEADVQLYRGKSEGRDRVIGPTRGVPAA